MSESLDPSLCLKVYSMPNHDTEIILPPAACRNASLQFNSAFFSQFSHLCTETEEKCQASGEVLNGNGKQCEESIGGAANRRKLT